MKTITIEGQLRTGFGKAATRELRSQGMVPGVIYGGEQEVNFQAPAAAFKSLVYTSSFQLAEIKLDGKTYKTILKDLQFDKVNDHLLHVDLLELVDDKKVVADIPLKFTGSAIGVKDGGKLNIKMKSLKVKTYPQYLQEQIEVPVDHLELNGNVRVEDVKVDHYEMLHSPRIPVASVTLTRQLKEETPVAAEGAVAVPAEGAAAGATATATAATPGDKGDKTEKSEKGDKAEKAEKGKK